MAQVTEAGSSRAEPAVIAAETAGHVAAAITANRARPKYTAPSAQVTFCDFSGGRGSSGGCRGLCCAAVWAPQWLRRCQQGSPHVTAAADMRARCDCYTYYDTLAFQNWLYVVSVQNWLCVVFVRDCFQARCA